MKTTVTILTVVWSGALVGGCVKYTTPIGPTMERTPAERNFESVWQAGLEVLRRRGFAPDRQDRRAGIITTAPTVGRQFFEPWRHDAATLFYVTENSLHSMYRVATVQVRPKAGADGVYEPKVVIQVYRSDLGAAHVTTTSEAYDLFASGSSGYLMAIETTETDVDPLSMPGGRTPLGRDGRLEMQMVRKIASTAARYLAESP